MEKSTKQKKCSFCGNKEDLKRRLIQAPNAVICEECIIFGYNFFSTLDKEKNNEFNYKDYSSPPPPEKIKKYLDQFIVGQTYAKKVLSVAAYNHYMRIYHNNKVRQREQEAAEKTHSSSTKKKKNKFPLHTQTDDIQLEKSNILLIGPTGTGKTLLAKTLAQLLHVPFAIADATSLTEAGYVGEDVENVLLKLYQAADNNIEQASHGIIFIDEIDKITRKTKNTSITRDVSGEGVQHALLKIIEGTVASIPPQGGRKHPNQSTIKMDTSNILFICSGAFVGLDEIVSARIYDTNVGFERAQQKEQKNIHSPLQEKTILENIHPDDLINFGLVPELIGRVPIVATLQEHTIDTLYKILVEPKNSIIKQMQTVFAYNNIELIVQESAKQAIAEKAYTQKIGARGIRAIIEKILLNVMFTSPSQNQICKVTITKECIEQELEPLIEYLTISPTARSLG